MLTLEQKQKAEEALAWALNHIGTGTFWHERHYPALRAALDLVPFDPTPANYVLSGLDAPAGTPGGELVSTADSVPDSNVPVEETPAPVEETPGKKGKGK